MGTAPGGQARSQVEYYNAQFKSVVDATLAALSDLGWYVEDRHYSGPDLLITARSGAATITFDTSMEIRVERSTAQGVAVRVSQDTEGRGGYVGQADALFQNIHMRLGL